VHELALLKQIRVVICLGAFAWDAALRLCTAASPTPKALPRPRPRFGHGAEYRCDPFTLLGCFHPSQQNTFTGRLTEAMIDTVLIRSRQLGGLRTLAS
jgi:uracil-DNA glycosylase